MNYTRIVMAAVAATVVDGLYGFLVWGKALAGEFSRYPDIYRPGSDMSAFPLMFAGIAVGMFFASCVYAKGYEGGGGLKEGARFGVLMGLFLAAYLSAINYGTMRIGMKMAATYTAGTFGEWLLAGITIGLVYNPIARNVASRASGV